MRVRISPGSACPHCGATGALIHRFEVEGGQRMGAMSGCVKLFPVHPIAKKDLWLREKERANAKRGYRMASWDLERRDALEAYYAGAIDEPTFWNRWRAADGKAKAYRTRRGYR